MKFELAKASKKLSALELKIRFNNLLIDVLWFRAMIMDGTWTIARHTHSSCEFHFIPSGSCRVALDDSEFTASAGEFYLTGPGVFHEQRHNMIQDMPDKLVEYSLNCDLIPLDDRPSEARALAEILKKNPCKLIKDTEGAIKLFHLILREANGQKPGFFSNIQCLTVQLLIAAFRSMKLEFSHSEHSVVKAGKDDYRLRQIERFIEDNIGNPLSARDVAGYIHLSEKQLSRILQKNKGVSTKEYVMALKLHKAKELLKESGLPVKQVAQQLGFSSEYYFSQFFKREEGFPPSTYRRNVQNV